MQQSLAVITNQRRAETLSYLEVVTAQNAALNNRRNAVNILGRRLDATVLRIKALSAVGM